MVFIVDDERDFKRNVTRLCGQAIKLFLPLTIPCKPNSIQKKTFHFNLTFNIM